MQPAHTLICKATALAGSAPSVVFLQPAKALPGSSAQPVCFCPGGEGSAGPGALPQWPRGARSRKSPGLSEAKETAPVVDSVSLDKDAIS